MVAKTDAARVRALVSQVMATHVHGEPYPEVFREELMAFARARVAEGVKLARAAAEIGISYWTVWGWFRAERTVKRKTQTTRPSRAIVPVHIVTPKVTDVKRGTLTITGPCGVRVEGADIETLAALLRRLS